MVLFKRSFASFSIRMLVICGVFLLGAAGPGVLRSAASDQSAANLPADVDDGEIDLALGGVGGVYLLVEPGELMIDVQKRDRNRTGRHAELRAILAGPDRLVLDQATIPDDGQARGSGLGPVQRVRLSARVARTGVYALNITVSQDRYGDETYWGFRTNARRYLVETARGHRDQRHEEPIVLGDTDRPADVYFLPPRRPFSIRVESLPAESGEAVLYDAAGAPVQRQAVDARGRATLAVSADPSSSDRPWRLQIPRGPATVQIDGVTRWERDDLASDACLWTPHGDSFFALARYRWLLSPYRQTVYGRPGEPGSARFRVHNNSRQQQTLSLSIEHPGEPWPVQLSAERLTLPPGETRELLASFTAPRDGETRVCHLRVIPEADPEFTTYSTLEVCGGASPADGPLAMPIVLSPYAHENAQFGYLPGYPVDNQMYFDGENRPWVRTAGGLKTFRDGQSVAIDLQGSLPTAGSARGAVPLSAASTKIAFDADGHLYALAMQGRRAALMVSADGGETFAAHEIPGRERQPRTFDVEQFSGHNVPEAPPPILRYTRTAEDPQLIWRKVNDLELFLPERTAAGIVIGAPILISEQCIGLSSHSGIPASVVSRGDQVHVVWGEATDPEEKVPGVPTFVATYDRSRRELSEPALVGYGPPANDIHNSPSITIDGQGLLHVLIGTHGRAFPYVRSLQPNDSGSGWTEAALAGVGLRQTYVGMVCGEDGALHCVFRLWQDSVSPFPHSHHAVLAYQRKKPGAPWEVPRKLVVPPFSEYSIFYHRLTIDRRGRLFVSYDYWSTFWFYRNDQRERRRSVLMSDDAGDSWRLAADRDFR